MQERSAVDSDPNSSSTRHSAPGAATGFVFQLQVSLLKLLPVALAHEEGAVYLELMDDVELAHRPGIAPELVQVHQSSGDRRLTDRSPKVWRTLTIWREYMKMKDVDEVATFTLLSTQTAAADSAVEAMTERGRNPDRARSLLEAIASESPGSKATASDRAGFLELTPTQRHALLNAITVVDGAAPPVGVREIVVRELAPTNEARYIESMADFVEGWWWSRIPAALDSGQPIHAEELTAAIDEARRQHSVEALPVFALASFEAEDLPETDIEVARFMQCLIDIRASDVRKQTAAEHYLLASAHRSRWARRGLLGTGEITSYENALSGEWLISSERMARKLAADATGDKATLGHDLWDEMEKASLPPIRRDTTDPFIQRGSLHRLADDGKVAWHPDAVAMIHSHLRPTP